MRENKKIIGRTSLTTDMYQSVTDSIIEAIEGGISGDSFTLPWNGLHQFPINVETQKNYSGMNVFSLWIAQEYREYKSGVWGTFQQWKKKGYHVRKGEKGVKVVFYRVYEAESEKDGELVKRFASRWSTIFNADQIEGYDIEASLIVNKVQSEEEIEQFIVSTGASIKQGGERAFYHRGDDFIALPDRGRFHSTEGYYSTLFHELVHWTGSADRLEREKGKKFGDDAYAFEELVAELGASFLCAHFGVYSESRTDHASYIASWLECFKGDSRYIFRAASQAQKAVDYLMS